MSPPPAERRPSATLLRRWPFGARSGAALGASLAHLLVGLPIAIIVFVLTVVLGALAFGLLIVYPIALPVLVAWVAVVRAMAGFERSRVRALLGFSIPEPSRPSADGTWHTRLWITVRHHTTWRAVGFHLVRLPLVVVSFSLAVAAVALPLALVMVPVSLVGAELSMVSGWVLVVAALTPLVGLLLLPLSAAVIDALAQLDAAVAASMLGISDADRRDHRIERLSSTRSDLVDIAEQERRRIERDLHDGAGQQLVSLAMTLGMAREKMRQDPQMAQTLIDEAHAEAKQALVGLRDIVRGISPAILTDRGLGAALSAVAARSSIPVALTVEVEERPDPVTEGIAYYVVCEAIGNAIRHADASSITVAIERRDDILRVDIEDDGHGGADPGRGTGLRGLAGRVAAVDGDLQVASPRGGPTVIRAQLPIRSLDPTTTER